MGVMVAMGVIMMVIFMRVVVVIMLVMAVVIMLIFMRVVIMAVIVMVVTMIVIVVIFMRMIVVAVVIMLIFMRMVIMAVVIMVMIVLIVVGVIIVVIPMIVMIVIMSMRLEQCALTELQQGHPIGIQKRGHDSLRGQRFNGVFHPRGQVRPNPEHQIGILQRRRLRGAQIVLMRRCALLDHQIRGADTVHDAGNQGVNRRDINSHVRSVGKGRTTHQNRDGGQRNEFRGHLRPYVIL